jgi:ATP:cob(I)alamin adenosyltransferase
MLYTRQGDSGRSDTKTRRNLGKDEHVFELIGTLEEAIGLARVAAVKIPETLLPILTELQDSLCSLKEEICGGDRFATSEKVAGLERAIDSIEASAPPNTDLPLGRTESGAALDVLWAVLRRAERKAVAMTSVGGISRDILAWLNRVSDLVWSVARLADRTQAAGSRRAEAAYTVQEDGFRSEAVRLCTAVLSEARNRGIRVVAAVCDAGANLVALVRDDDAYIASVDIAMNKAYTSVSLKMETKQIGELTQPGAPLYGLQLTNQGRIVTFGGGVPLIREGRLLGALGVSGGSAEQDTALAEWGAKQF